MTDYRTGDRSYSEMSSSSYRKSGGYDDRYDRDYDRGGDYDRDYERDRDRERERDRGSSYSRREEYKTEEYGGRADDRGDVGDQYYRREGRNMDADYDRGDSYGRRVEITERSEHRSRDDGSLGGRSGGSGGGGGGGGRSDSRTRSETYRESDSLRGDTRTRSPSARRETKDVRDSSYTRDGGSGYRETTTTTVSSAGGTYRPIVTPRSVVIQRTGYGMVPNYGSSRGSRGYSVERSWQMGSGMRGGFAPEAYGAMTHSNVSSMMESREREKRDMQDLNERFASYIEKVRFLEAQNKRLADELEKLRASWGKETSAVKAMYQTELEEARRLLDDSERNKAKLEIRLSSLEEQLDELRQRESDAKREAEGWKERAEKLNQQLSDSEAEISLLRRRVDGFEVDKDKEKKQIAYLTDALNRARLDLENETLQHIDAENRRQTLEEELEFLKAIHEQEMRELAALAYRDTTPENREFWKNEMGQALREIQQVYDDKLDNIRGEMEFFYNTKIQEFTTSNASRQGPGGDISQTREESKRMRSYINELSDKMTTLDSKNAQLIRELETVKRDRDEREREWERENGDLKVEVAKLRAELEAILKELQHIMNAKMGLELEIEAYRKLLETEETRLSRRGVSDTSFGDDRRPIHDIGDKGRYPDRDKYGGRDRYDQRESSSDSRGRDYKGTDYPGQRDNKGGGGGGGGGGGAHIDRDGMKPPADRDRKPSPGRDYKPPPSDKDSKPISDIAGRGSADAAGGRGGSSATARGGAASGGTGRGGGQAGDVVKPSQPSDGFSGGGRGGGTAGDSAGRGGATAGRGGGDAGGGRGAYTGGRGGVYQPPGRGGAYTGGRGGVYQPPGRGGSTAVVEPKIQPKSDSKTQAAPWEEEEVRPEHQAPVERTPARTSFQRSSKGPVSVAECAPDGKFISLENTGQKDEFIGGWMLSRVVDDLEKVTTVFPSDLVLRAGDKIRIWAKGTKPLNASALDVETNVKGWGVGANAATKLTNMAGDERASHVQKTTY